MDFPTRRTRKLFGVFVFLVIFVILIVLLTALAALFGLGISFFELPLVVVLALVGTWIVFRRLPASNRATGSDQPKP
jgi:hypothetical protein